MKRFATFLTSQPESSLIYLIEPNSLSSSSADSIFNISISNLVILSFIASIRVDTLSLFSVVSFNWSSNDLRLALFAFVISCPVFLSTVCVVVLLDKPSRNFDMSLSNTSFSFWSSTLISSKRFFLTSMFLIFLLLISSFAIFP